MAKKVELKASILDTAMRLADSLSWERLHLHDVAAELNVKLEEIYPYYRQKDDFRRASPARQKQPLL